MLVKYVRNKSGQRIGVVVAVDKNRIGWSKCNFSKGDKFDKERGKYIALKRAEKYKFQSTLFNKHLIVFKNNNGQILHNRLPHPICPSFLEMVERAQYYFQE